MCEIAITGREPCWPRTGATVLSLCLPLTLQASLISSFQAGDGGWHLGTLAVGNLDGTPDLEIVVPYRNSAGQWMLDALAGGDEMNVSPTLFDLDGDGLDEIIFLRANHVVALRGDESVIWSDTVSSANYLPDGGYQTVTNGFYWSDGGGFKKPRLD